jgi:hypothetical protein
MRLLVFRIPDDGQSPKTIILNVLYPYFNYFHSVLDTLSFCVRFEWETKFHTHIMSVLVPWSLPA